MRMPSLSELPGEIPRQLFLNALRRLGFEINMSGGNGSHVMATWASTQKSVTVQQHLPKQVLKYLLKEIETVTMNRVTWEVIKEKLYTINHRRTLPSYL